MIVCGSSLDQVKANVDACADERPLPQVRLRKSIIRLLYTTHEHGGKEAQPFSATRACNVYSRARQPFDWDAIGIKWGRGRTGLWLEVLSSFFIEFYGLWF